MKVRELIENLLDYDMDYEVEIELNTNVETDWAGFDFDDNFRSKQVYLTVDLSDYALVESDRLEELEEAEERLEELED